MHLSVGRDHIPFKGVLALHQAHDDGPIDVIPIVYLLWVGPTKYLLALDNMGGENM